MSSVSIIQYFDEIKIYRIDTTDNQLKKSKLETSQGLLEIHLDDTSNQINLIACASDPTDTQVSRIIYFNLNLNDIDLDCLLNKNPIEPNRVEVKKNFLNKNCYFNALEFKTQESLNQFRDIIKLLSEAYLCQEQRMDGLDELCKLEDTSSKKIKLEKNLDNNLDYLCERLSLSIKYGDVESSIQVVKELALLSCDLYIRPNKVIDLDRSIEIITETIREKEPDNLTKILVCIKPDVSTERFEISLDVSRATVLDLKIEIAKKSNLKVEEQLLIINENTTKDTDLIQVYYYSMPKTSAAANVQEDFKAFVFYSPNKKLNEFNEQNNRLKQKDDVAIMDVNKQNYYELAAYYEQELNENLEPFDCLICLEDNVPPLQGVVLKECMHTFCKECLKNHINHSDDPVVKCPYSKDYICGYSLQDREIRALLSQEDYSKFELKSLRQSEATMQNTVHCKTPDCIGFCISEDNLNFFDCPVCEKVNCLRCNVIHMGETCKEYQDNLKIKAVNDKNAQKDQEALEKLIKNKKAMYCPGCKIILCKQDGCDWLQCAMCKMEICWATRGPRWGPGGRGDTSGGCKCNYAAGKPCDPKCGNCH